MELSNVNSLAYARRIYVDHEEIGTVAEELGVGQRTFYQALRGVFPRLISEENWGIPEVLERLGGRELPLEMRKEVHALSKKHGPKAAVELTTASLGSVTRWGRGEYGEKGVQKMGRLPWKSLITSPVPPSKEPQSPVKTHKHGQNRSIEDRRSAVYLMITAKPDIQKLADKHGVSVTALYNWRAEMLGKVGTNEYKPNCEAFIHAYAEVRGEEPKPLVIRRNQQTPVVKKKKKKKKTDSRRSFSKTLKREVVNRLVNHNELCASLSAEFEVPEGHIWAWRLAMLGKTGTVEFKRSARALAREFVTEARTDDIVAHANGRDTNAHAQPQQMSPPSQPPQQPQPQQTALLPTQLSNLESVVEAQPDAIVAQVQHIDHQLLTLGKDRQLLVQQLEIQKLRRELSQNNR